MGRSGAETGHAAPVRLEHDVSESQVKAPRLGLSESLRAQLTPVPTASLFLPAGQPLPHTQAGHLGVARDGAKEAGLGGGAKDRTAVLYVAKYF